MGKRNVCLMVIAALAIGGAGAAEHTDPFTRKWLDPNVWNACQADLDELIKFRRHEGRDVLINRMVESRGEDFCYPPQPCDEAPRDDDYESLERLGVSLIEATAPQDAHRPCVSPITDASGKPIVQRNELRFHRKPNLVHDLREPHWYGLTFKMNEDNPICGSTRWVSAQWKYNDDERPTCFDESPFLAQRFDNAVLHVTVQNGDCRCMVAKAPGDVDRQARRPEASRDRPREEELVEYAPLKCKWSKQGAGEGKKCEPEDFQLFAPPGPAIPALPDPEDQWVNMLYYIQGDGDGPGGVDGRVDIYANGDFVVRVIGAIGYPHGSPGRVKFKFGTYRDKLPGESKTYVDEVCVAHAATTCDPDVRLLQ